MIYFIFFLIVFIILVLIYIAKVFYWWINYKSKGFLKIDLQMLPEKIDAKAFNEMWNKQGTIIWRSDTRELKKLRNYSGGCDPIKS